MPETFVKASKEQLIGADLLGDNLLLKRYPPEEKSEGGLFLPDTAQQHLALAWIVKIGEGVDNRRSWSSEEPVVPRFKVGQTVLYPLHMAQDLPEMEQALGEPGARYLYIRASDVVLHVKESGEPI